MLNITYLAILEPGEDGSYSISFPDLPGCFSYGNNLEEAQHMAAEAASLHVYGMEQDPRTVYKPAKRGNRRKYRYAGHNTPGSLPDETRQ